MTTLNLKNLVEINAAVSLANIDRRRNVKYLLDAAGLWTFGAQLLFS